MRIDRKVNFADIVQRAILIEEITHATGLHNVSIAPAREKASLAQHGYYRSTLLPIAKRWLNETQGGDEWGDDFDEESTHNWLKIFLRGKPVVNKKTGEVIGMAAVSHAMYSTKEMTEFIEDVMDLFKRNDVRFPLPNKNHNQQPAVAGGRK